MPRTRQHAFVVMSFGTNRSATFEKGIRPAVESLGMDAVRVDHDHFTGKITEQIVERLRGAYFIIGEMSEQRPNCYYEVGYAHALSRPVILLIDDPSKIHFDIQDFPFIIYSDYADLRRKLTERVIGAVLKQHEQPTDDDARCGKFGGCATRNGRLLSAVVTRAGRSVTDLTLAVTALPNSRPLTGKVRFYLHNTYTPASYTVDVKNGAALLDIDAKGAFTVGAKADGDQTSLELNLVRIPGAERRFYET